MIFDESLQEKIATNNEIIDNISINKQFLYCCLHKEKGVRWGRMVEAGGEW